MKGSQIILRTLCAAAFLSAMVAAREVYARETPSPSPELPLPAPESAAQTGEGPQVFVPSESNAQNVQIPPLGDRGLFGVAIDVSDEEADRLIEVYKRQAGKVGPRKVFSAYRVSPHFGVGVVYDDNILTATNQKKKSDEITVVTGGMTVSLGDFQQRRDSYLIFDYTAAGELFFEHSEEDALNQDASLNLQYHWNQLVARLASRFQSLRDSTADFGERIRRNVYDEALAFRYERNDRSAFQSELTLAYSDYATPVDILEVALNNSFDWQIIDKVRAGVGVTVGRLEATGEVGETYEQALARFNYDVTDKVLVQLQAGAEFRQGRSNASDDVIPVFALTGRWTPQEGTALTLDAYRRVEASASQSGEDFIDTGFRLSIRQRLIRRFYSQFDASYDHAGYESVTVRSLPQRTDNYYLLRGALGYDFVDWFKTQIFYQRRQDDSTRDAFAFESNRIGVQFDLIY